MFWSCEKQALKDREPCTILFECRCGCSCCSSHPLSGAAERKDTILKMISVMKNIDDCNIYFFQPQQVQQNRIHQCPHTLV